MPNCYTSHNAGNQYFHNFEYPESSSHLNILPQAVFDICRRLHLPSQPSQDFQRCMSCQHRRSRYLRTSIPLFFIVSDSDFQIPACPSLALHGQIQESVIAGRSNLLTAVVMTALDSVNSRSPLISYLTRGKRIRLVVSAVSI
jgi:hypothetical protein